MDRLNRIRREIRLIALGIILFGVLMGVVMYALTEYQFEPTAEETKVIQLTGQENVTLHTLVGDKLSFNNIGKIVVSQPAK